MKFLKSLSAVALVVASMGAHAATTWQANVFTPTNSANASFTDSASGVTTTIYAYSSAPGTGNTLSAATLRTIGTSPTGLGVQGAGTSPVDANGLDNTAGIDAMILHFTTGGSAGADSAQFISSFSVAQSTTSSGGCGTNTTCGTDSDVSLLRWTGTGTPTGTPAALTTLGTALTSGWSLVGNFANAATAAQATGTTSTSSWWLISAYNSNWGTGTGLDSGNDCVDVLSFVTGTTTTPGRTPEPGSAALAAVALLGAFAVRRRRRPGN